MGDARCGTSFLREWGGTLPDATRDGLGLCRGERDAGEDAREALRRPYPTSQIPWRVRQHTRRARPKLGDGGGSLLSRSLSRFCHVPAWQPTWATLLN